MEAVGRLAGGVAHDFNNALCVIIGSAELALDVTRTDHGAYELLQSICDAGRRGAQIVRQLLAFARKETAAAVGLNPNTALTSVYGMLSRLIGEDIELKMALQPDVWRSKSIPRTSTRWSSTSLRTRGTRWAAAAGFASRRRT
jgi:signal transduction histidine kinase